MSSQDAGEAFSWLLTDFVENTAGTLHAVAVSADGIALATSESMASANADKFAAITAGLSSLVHGAADCFGETTVERVLIEMGSSFLMVTSVSHGCVLGVICAKDADLGKVAYEMTLFAQRAGSVLSPQIIADLQNTLVV
ncbi:MAG: roadblock/LC7 domain-containing protein [Acidimicrobiia bacterium]|nr:roadblock/LC7 domain-containing protein [Acidimicrobiia bacterium]